MSNIEIESFELITILMQRQGDVSKIFLLLLHFYVIHVFSFELHVGIIWNTYISCLHIAIYI